jgi:hypothetical protein
MYLLPSLLVNFLTNYANKATQYTVLVPDILCRKMRLMTLIKFLRMQANPDKFQALAIGKKTFKEQIGFDLNGSKIKCEELQKEIQTEK